MNRLHWLYRKENHRRLWQGGAVVLAVVVLAELMIHRHSYFGIDGWFGFSAVYGFITCVVMVVAAKLLGYLIKRREDYYDD